MRRATLPTATAAALLASSLLGAGGSRAQDAGAAASPFVRLEGAGALEAVAHEVTGSTGDAARDARIREQVAERVVQVGASDPAALALAAQRVRAIGGVAAVDIALRPSGLGAAAVLRVQLAPSAPARPAFPKLVETPGALLKLTLSGGVGVYSEGQAFYGDWAAFNASSPVAAGPPTGARRSFLDYAIAPGVTGFLQLGDTPLYAYGEASVMATGTVGADIYREDSRVHVDVEKAFAGLVWAPSRQRMANLSYGRNNFTLNDGFLIHHVKGSTNVGDRRALYLGGRTAFDRALLASVRWDRWSAKAFGLDPNEYEPLESNSTFAGLNLRYEPNDRLAMDLTHIENTASDTRFPTPQGLRVPREGIRTSAAHLRWRDALGMDGAFLESEIARQRSDRADVDARAGYASLGYRWTERRWKPALVLRHAQWSGDDPTTPRYERWDPLLPAGSDEWMGGIIFSKTVANANLRQFRLRAFAEPSPTFNFSIDWFSYRAMETNNLGATPLLGTLASRDLGQEWMFTGRWFVDANLYVQTIASVNRPGAALRQALPRPAKTWTSLQASLYWFY